jgi:preprotein translocase subunit SecF
MARMGAFGRLYRGETSFDFAGRWKRWFVISGAVILVGLISVGARGVNFSIDFKGGTVWQVPTSASVSQVRTAVTKVNSSLGQATIQVLFNHETGKRTVEVEAAAKATTDQAEVTNVTSALATLGHVSTNDVAIDAVGPSWGSDITNKAIKAVIIFLIAVTVYIWFRFEGKMAVAALVALVHDILVTVGIYSLSGFQVSPDTVIAFLTILGYSLYDTIVVFDKVQENTRGVASSNRLTYSETVNLSMNQVLARSLNTSFVAIIPILSILVIGAGLLGASTLNDFGLALFIGLTTGAYSSIFIASPLLALLKEREPRYAEIRRRLGSGGSRRLSPIQAATGGVALAGANGTARAATQPTAPRAAAPRPTAPTMAAPKGPAAPRRRPATPPLTAPDADAGDSEAPAANGAPDATTPGAGAAPSNGDLARRPIPPRSGNRPPPRPRKKKGGRR